MIYSGPQVPFNGGAIVMIIAKAYILLVVTWLLYIEVMAALRVWNNLHWVLKTHLLPLGAVFIVLDVVVNITIGSLLFLELPRWWTLSERLNHHALRAHGWRTFMAQWICSRLLNPFDPDGHHCGEK